MSEWVVYKHTSPSGKVYIGITSKKPLARWGKRGQGYINNAHFWSAIQKYGWESFRHEILFTGLTKEKAGEEEKKLIEEYNSTDPKKGYNIALGGYDGKHGEETRQKISHIQKIKWADPEYKQKQIENFKSRWADPEYRKAHTGENHPNYGKNHLSEDARERISAARKKLGSPWAKGRVCTEETRARISESVRKTHPHRKWTDEQKEKGRIAKLGDKNPNYGKPLDEETKRKLIETHSIRIEQVKDGEVVGVFSSAKDAQRETGICAVNIRRVCNGERMRAGGYCWRNAED